MTTALMILLGIAMAAVLVILTLGVANMARGGQSSGHVSNKLMQYRVIFQAIAILLFGAVMFLLRR